MSKKIDNFREKWDSKSLKPSKRPKCDFYNLENNRNIRINHLSVALFNLYNLYKNNKELYGDAFLAFVADKIIRHWPWKDYLYMSENAYKLLNEDLTGMDRNQQEYKDAFKDQDKVFVYEHHTPLSFFRDLFELDGLSQSDFEYALKTYYKVVLITKEEDKKLTENGNKTTRPLNAYKECGITIHLASQDLLSKEWLTNIKDEEWKNL